MPSSRTFLTAGLLAATGASVVYWLLTLRWLRRDFPRGAGTESLPTSDLPPVTFLRPIKRGVPRLAEKLAMLAKATRPGDQIVLGADPHSEELAVAEQTRSAFPEQDIAVVVCAPGAAINPKISKLLQMQTVAQHGHWVVTDSEAQLDQTFCDEFRKEWLRCDVLTAGYRINALQDWPQRLDAAAVLLTLWPGLAAVQRAGALRFTLGACTGFRAADLAQVGGWKAFGDDLAEDHRLGVALARAGRRIALSRQIVTLESDPLSWRKYWLHQRRVAVTYRVANPRGFAGMAVIHGVTWSLLLASLHRANPFGWLFFAAVWLLRWRTAAVASRQLGFPIKHLPVVLLIASLVETACAALSWVDRRIWWGRWRRVTRAGKLLPADFLRPSALSRLSEQPLRFSA